MGFVIFNLDKKTKKFLSAQVHRVIPGKFETIEEVKEYCDKKNKEDEHRFYLINTDKNVFEALSHKESAKSIKRYVNDVEESMDDLRNEISSLTQFVEQQLKEEEEILTCDECQAEMNPHHNYCWSCGEKYKDN